MDVFERFRDYFQEIANTFDNEGKCSRIFKNNPDAGSTREDIFAEFLRRHLPLRAKVIKGGFIFDSLGNESKQIDLIIINDATVQFNQFSGVEQGGKSFSIIEGCYGAISIKTTLNKNELFDSLENYASIPPMPALQINPMLKDRDFVQSFPIGTIFAFKGMDVKTTLEHLSTFYDEHKEIPINRKPTFIIVNNQYIIRHIDIHGAKTKNGTPVLYDTFHPMKMKYVGAYSLWYLLAEYASTVKYGPHTLLNFEPYTIKMTDAFGLSEE